MKPRTLLGIIMCYIGIILLLLWWIYPRNTEMFGEEGPTNQDLSSFFNAKSNRDKFDKMYETEYNATGTDNERQFHDKAERFFIGSVNDPMHHPNETPRSMDAIRDWLNASVDDDGVNDYMKRSSPFAKALLRFLGLPGKEFLHA